MTLAAVLLAAILLVLVGGGIFLYRVLVEMTCPHFPHSDLTT